MCLHALKSRPQGQGGAGQSSEVRESQARVSAECTSPNVKIYIVVNKLYLMFKEKVRCEWEGLGLVATSPVSLFVASWWASGPPPQPEPLRGVSCLWPQRDGSQGVCSLSPMVYF